MDRETEIAELRARLAELEAQKGAANASASSPRMPSTIQAGSGLWIFAIIIACVVGYMVLGLMMSPQTPDAGSAQKEGVAAPSPGSEPPFQQANEPASAPTSDTGATQSTWIYSDDVDQMTDKVTHVACTNSINKVHLNWPYSDVDARLCVRKSPKYGLDVFIALNGDGQILCRSYDGCTVHVRYDKRPRQANRASGASDGSSNVIFMNGESRIVEQLRHTDTFLVEVEFYQAGDQMLEFRTADFEWK